MRFEMPHVSGLPNRPAVPGRRLSQLNSTQPKRPVGLGIASRDDLPMCEAAAVEPGGSRGAYAWTDICTPQPLVHHLS